jgi:hypothetical protein
MNGPGAWTIRDATSRTARPFASAGPNACAVLPVELRERIMACARPRDWDGEGTRGISLAACRAAMQLVVDVHRAVVALPWPLAGVARWGAIALVWRLGEGSVTAFLPPGRDGAITYQWEGPGYVCGEARGTRRDILEAITHRWVATVPRWAVTAGIASLAEPRSTRPTAPWSAQVIGEAAG